MTPAERAEQLIDAAEKQQHLFFYGKVIINAYKLQNGFVVLGVASLVDMSKYSYELGDQYARQDAITNMCQITGFMSHDAIPAE